MAKASLTIAIGGEYQGRDAIRKAELDLKAMREEARQLGGASSGIMKLGDSMVDLGSNMEAAGQKFTDAGAKLTKLTAPIAAVGAASVKLAADYENSVAKVYTIMDKQAMSTEQMSKNILDLSTSTGKSATELADAAYQALSASVATDKVAGFVEDAVKLSKAGFTETATAVDTLTTVINAYGYSADDAAMISNRLVQTQNKGKTTVDELASSMGNVIPTASAYNVSLDNLCSAYVIMTKQGINTANATTAINGMLTELADGGSTVAKVLQEKTGKSFGQLMSDGATLGDVIQLLSDHVDGNSEAFANLWGNVRASKGALAIANAGAADFSGAMQDMANSTGLVDSALDDLATPMGKVNKAMNALKNTGIQLGEEIIGAAAPTIEPLAAKAQELYKWFDELDDATKQSIVRFGALAVAAGPVVTLFGKGMTAVGGFVTKLGKGVQSVGTFSAAMKAAETQMKTAGAATVGLGDKMKAAATSTGLATKAMTLLKGTLGMLGIGAAVAAVGLIVAKYQEWRAHTEQVEKATSGLENAMGAAKSAYDAYTPSIDGATRALGENAVSAESALASQAALADKMNETWSKVGEDAAMIDYYASEIDRLGKMGRLTSEEQARLSVAVEAFNQLTGSSIEVLDAEHGRLNTTRDAILGVAEAYKEEAKAAAAKELLIELDKQQYQDEIALKQAKGELAEAESQYQDALKNYPEAAFSYGEAVNQAKRKVDEMERALKSTEQAEQDLYDLLGQSPVKFKTMEDALASCGTSIEGLGNVTDEQLATMRQNFDGTLQSIYDSCVAQGINIPDGLAQGIEQSKSKPTDSMGGVVTSLVEKAKSMLESHSPSQVMFRIGTDVDDGLSNGIDGSASKPETAMSKVAEALRRAVASLPEDSRRTGSSSGANMASAISQQSNPVANAARSIYQSAASGIAPTPGMFSSTGSSAAWSFSGAIGSASAYGSGRSLAGTAQSGLGSVSADGVGRNFAWGFSNGMGSVSIWQAAYNIGMNALSGIKSALGIASPSKEAAKVGEWFGEGAVQGMQRTERAIASETRRLSDLMELTPTPYGASGPRGALASNGQPTMVPSTVNMAVTVNVNASNASEGRAAGTSLADALYEELRRKMGSSLWPVSYSTE